MRKTQPITLSPAPDSRTLIDQLAQYQQLPILAGTQQRLLTALHRRNATAESVAAACQHDPVMQLRLWLQVNRLLNQSGNELYHLAHAISLLGMPQVERIVRSAHTLDTPNSGYSEVLLQSTMAMALVDHLAVGNALDHERLSKAALFSRYPEWALWYFQPEKMTQWQGLKVNPALHLATVEKQLLGMSVHEIGQRLCQKIHLPSPAPQVWEINPQQHIATCAHRLAGSAHFDTWLRRHPEQESLFFGRANTIMLANHVIACGATHWQHRHSLRAQRLLAMHLNLHPDKLSTLVHQVAVHSTMTASEWPHPANRLLQYWDMQAYIEPLSIAELPVIPSPTAVADQQAPEPAPQSPRDTAFEQLNTPPRTKPAPQPTGVIEGLNNITPTPKSSKSDDPLEFLALDPDTSQNPLPAEPEPAQQSVAPSAPFSNQTLLSNNLHRLMKRGDHFANLNQLLLFALETLNEGVGLEKVMMMVLHDKQTSLRSHYTRGIDDDDSLKQLNIALDTKTRQGIIGQLLKKPAGLHITNDNITQVLHKLPSQLQAAIEPETTALMSLFRGNNPVGIFYAFDPHLEHKRFAQFKQVCSATSTAIESFAARRYRQKAAQ